MYKFLLLILVVILYFNTMDNGFYFDDTQSIVENFYLHIKELDIPHLKQVIFKSTVPNRPIANISLALNYYFDSLNVQGYHLVNLLIHLITSIILYKVLEKTFALTVLYKKDKKVLALAASLIWAAHPVNIQAVTYIIQRMTSMATMFYLLTLLFYLKSKEDNKRLYLFYPLAILSWLLAMGCKEISAMLPFMIFLYEVTFFNTRIKSAVRILSLWLIPVFIIGFFYIGGFSGIKGTIGSILNNSYSNRDYTIIDKVFTQSRVMFYYLSLMVFPLSSRLTLDYDFPLSLGIFNPYSTFISIILLAVTIFFSIKGVLQHKSIAGFSILWYLLNLLIESSIFNLEVVYEHRLYLPGIGIIILLVISIYKIINEAVNLTYRVKAAFIFPFIAIFIVCQFSFFTIKRNFDWKNGITLWSSNLENSPHDHRIYNNLGKAYNGIGNYKKGILYLNKAIKLNPEYSKAYNNRAINYGSRRKVKEAIEDFKMALKFNPKNGKACFNLALTYERIKRYKEALFYYKKAARLGLVNAILKLKHIRENTPRPNTK